MNIFIVFIFTSSKSWTLHHFLIFFNFLLASRDNKHTDWDKSQYLSWRVYQGAQGFTVLILDRHATEYHEEHQQNLQHQQSQQNIRLQHQWQNRAKKEKDYTHHNTSDYNRINSLNNNGNNNSRSPILSPAPTFMHHNGHWGNHDDSASNDTTSEEARELNIPCACIH